MRGKKLVNGDGEYYCLYCGEWKPEEEFYEYRKSCCKECVVQRAAAWNTENRDRVLAYKKNYRKTWNGRYHKIRDEHIARTGEPLGPEDNLTLEDLLYLYELQDHKCAGCGKPIENLDDWQYDHCISVANGGHLTLNNAQLLCESCNRKKGKNNAYYLKIAIEISVKTAY